MAEQLGNVVKDAGDKKDCVNCNRQKNTIFVEQNSTSGNTKNMTNATDNQIKTLRSKPLCISSNFHISEFWGLVNNAGVINMGEIELVPLDLIQQHLHVNTIGTIRMCKAFLPLLRKSHGRIVNISSVVGS